MRSVCVILIVFCFSCKQQPGTITNTVLQPVVIPAVIVLSADTFLQVYNGVYFYKGQPFSGTVQSNYATGVVQSLEQFYNGKQEGVTKTFFEDGSKQSLRFYSNGEKDSIHTGWWNNGNPRFQYHFSKGNYNGSFKEFYESGKPLKEVWYINGNDSCGRGWRESGKPFMNYVTKDGRRYGLMNAQLCYNVKKEKGEYMK